MAANIGRSLVVKKGTVAIAGIQSKSITANGEPVDITSDDDSGYRTLLSVAGNASLDISFEGVTKDNIMRQAMLTNTTLELTDISIDFPNGDTITGTFFLSNMDESGSYNDAVKFSGTLQSSGAWTYTPV